MPDHLKMTDKQSAAGKISDAYTGLQAEWHDLFWLGEGGSREARWWCGLVDEAAGPGARVLDAGCGSGRILVPLAKAGHQVTGIECSAEMLDAARRRLAADGLHARLVEGDLCAPPRGRFDVVISAGFTLMLVDPEALPNFWRAAFSRLRPGGMLAATFFMPWNELLGNARPGWNTDRLVVLPDGGLASAKSRTRLDRWTQVMHRELLFEHFAADGRRIRRTRTRETTAYYLPRELRGQLSAAGFQQIGFTGEWSRRAPRGDDRFFLVRARRGG